MIFSFLYFWPCFTWISGLSLFKSAPFLSGFYYMSEEGQMALVLLPCGIKWKDIKTTFPNILHSFLLSPLLTRSCLWLLRTLPGPDSLIQAALTLRLGRSLMTSSYTKRDKPGLPTHLAKTKYEERWEVMATSSLVCLCRGWFPAANPLSLWERGAGQLPGISHCSRAVLCAKGRLHAKHDFKENDITTLNQTEIKTGFWLILHKKQHSGS